MSAEKYNANDPAAAPPYQPAPDMYHTPIQPDHAYVETPAPVAAPVPSRHVPQQQNYPTATPLHALQRTPAVVDCPQCGHREMSRIECKSGKTTHGWAAVICCCLCMGCLPYMLSSLKDVHHHCAMCDALLATWHNSGRVEVAGSQNRAERKK